MSHERGLRSDKEEGLGSEGGGESGSAGPRCGLVTGAARGLGEAVAARLIRDGWNVALVDIESSVTQTASRLAALRPGSLVPAFVGDVSDEAFCDEAVDRAQAHLGGLDALVNSAGIGGPMTPVLETDVAAFRRVLEVNLVGSFLMARAVGRVLIERGDGGCIVNISSIAGHRAVTREGAYSASKAGVHFLTQTLAHELAPYRIRANEIAPGHMATEMHRHYMQLIAEERGTTLEDELEALRATIPLGRHGTGDDIAGAVVWLLSEDAAYVTGQTIAVDGGVLSA